MKQVLAIVVVVAGAATALGYSGATVSVFENDMTVPNATVFTVPAAAGMPGARLLYDNSALLSFSADHTAAGTNWVTLPLVGSGVTIHGVDYEYRFAGRVTGINDTLGLFTNTQGTPSTTAPFPARFPTNIPRPGRDPWADYTAVQFDLGQAAQQFGVFVAMNTNAGSYNGMDDNNVLMQLDRVLTLAILGPTDTFATAQYVGLSVGGKYAPFIKVASNGTDPIKSVCVVQNTVVETGAPFGFFDPYSVVPEPVSMLLLGAGLLALVRRRV